MKRSFLLLRKLKVNNPIARNMIPVYMDLSDIDLIIRLWNL